MVRSLRELFVDDLDLLLEHLAGVHTVVARVSRASLQADTAASTDLLDRFFQLRAEHVPQLTVYRLSTINSPELLGYFFKLRAEHIHLASGVIPHAGCPIGLNRVAP